MFRGFAFGLAFVWLATGCENTGGGRVVAEVNGYVISAEELEREYRQNIASFSEQPTPDQARLLRLQVLGELIDQQIMVQHAERKGLLAIDSEVQSRYEAFRSPFESDAAFEASLAERGTSPADFRAELRRTISIEKLLHREIGARVEVSEVEMREYYDERKGRFNNPEERVHLAQIMVTPTPEVPVPNLRNDDAADDESARQKIDALATRLEGGEDFGTLAQNYSEDPISTSNGGDLGFIPKSSLEQTDLALRQAVAALSPGEVSPPIRTDSGYRIIWLIEREEAGQREFTDPRVQQSIRETLKNRKEQLLRSAYLDWARADSRVTNYYAEEVVASFGAGD